MTPVRLHCVVEGQTEAAFVKRVMAPDLALHSVFADAHLITTGRRHGRAFRGGLVRYEHLATDLCLWMKQDRQPDAWFTTMVDLYALPADFPGNNDMPRATSALDRVKRLEDAMANDIADRLGSLAVSKRFIPYIQLHEFEALLFSDPGAFQEAFPGNEALVKRIRSIGDPFSTPEEIDGGQTTAPSKRILAVAPDYEKAVAGPLIAQRIGIEAMVRTCPHFGDWTQRLRSLGQREPNS